MTYSKSWDEVFMQMAQAAAMRSRCIRFQAGAIIVDRENRLVASGYNGPPKGEPLSRERSVHLHRSENTCLHWCERARKDPAELAQCYTDCPSVHAEANALMFCDRRDRLDGTIYVNGTICWDCAKLIANSGLRRVVYLAQHKFEHRESERGVSFMRSCGLRVHEYAPNAS